jgi:hypothetical protein
MAKTNKHLDSIHIIKADKTEKDSKRIETIYTMIGTQDYLEDEYPCLTLTSTEAEEAIDAYAMKIQIGERVKYYAKRGRHGRLFNPIGMYSEGMASKRLGHAGKLEWRFVEIKERAFEFYRNFLKTRNLAYLTNAERELL